MGWCSIDLFFVLSGFLIGGILMDQKKSESFFGPFYIRRFFRIIPAYAVSCFGFFAALRIFHLSGDLASHPPLPWYYYATFTQNIWSGIHHQLDLSSLGTTWSLAVEEQFYLTLPLLIRFVPDKKLIWIVCISIVGAPLFRVLCYLHDPAGWVPRFVLMPSQADALMLGVAGAWLVRRPAAHEFLVSRPGLLHGLVGIFGGGLLLMLILGWQQSSTIMTLVGYTWIDFFWLSFLFFAVLHPGRWAGRMMRSEFLRWAGTISYAVYLIHAPILAATQKFLLHQSYEMKNISDVMITCLALGITTLVALLSWYLFERPLLRYGHSVASYEKPLQLAKAVKSS